MHSDEDFQFAKRMIAWCLNDCQVSRLVGINRVTIREWRTGKVRGGDGIAHRNACPRCGHGSLNPLSYAYLLGLYLGDGCISSHPRGVFKLRVSLDDRYPGIIDSCQSSIEELLVKKKLSVGRVACIGCTAVYSYWKHWPCVFPQHGRGPKHLRRIKLRKWQQVIVSEYPHLLLRGLIHSDGCRAMNTVHGRNESRLKTYSYARYLFTNNSADIRGIFCDACERYGVAWRRMNWKTVAVSRRADVQKLEEIIGPKR